MGDTPEVVADADGRCPRQIQTELQKGPVMVARPCTSTAVRSPQSGSA